MSFSNYYVNSPIYNFSCLGNEYSLTSFDTYKTSLKKGLKIAVDTLEEQVIDQSMTFLGSLG